MFLECLLKRKGHTLFLSPIPSILLSEKHIIKEEEKGHKEQGHTIALLEMEEAIVPSNIMWLIYQPLAVFLQISLEREWGEGSEEREKERERRRKGGQKEGREGGRKRKREWERERETSVLFKPTLLGGFLLYSVESNSNWYKDLPP